MIRPLRRRHRWMIAALFAVVIAGTAVALLFPAPSPRMDALPDALTNASERP